MTRKEFCIEVLGFTPEEYEDACNRIREESIMPTQKDPNAQHIGSVSWSGSAPPGSLTIPAGGSTSAPTPQLQVVTMSSVRQTLKIVSSPEEKIIVEYIIVLNDGTCMELLEDPKITPREMIGICKFINAVQTVISSGEHGLVMHWSKMVEELGIDRHFVPGLADYKMYHTDEEILYMFLFDPAP